MFKSNLINKLLQIAALWTAYFIAFTNDAFSYSQNKPFFILATALYILLTLYILWRIKKPSKKAREIENES